MAETVASQQETAIVTGGSRGLGRGIVEALAARQMRVVAVARGHTSLEAAAKAMRVELPTIGQLSPLVVQRHPVHLAVSWYRSLDADP